MFGPVFYEENSKNNLVRFRYTFFLGLEPRALLLVRERGSFFGKRTSDEK